MASAWGGNFILKSIKKSAGIRHRTDAIKMKKQKDEIVLMMLAGGFQWRAPQLWAPPMETSESSRRGHAIGCQMLATFSKMLGLHLGTPSTASYITQ